MRWGIIALLFLISCAPAAQEVMTKPKVDQQPMQQVIAPPVLEPEIKAPQQVVQPTATQAPTTKPVVQKELSPYEECLQDCDESCAATAQNSCTQRDRSGCKDICNDNPIVDPSACTQACSYLPQPSVCKQQMDSFCSAQCVNYCH